MGFQEDTARDVVRLKADDIGTLDVSRIISAVGTAVSAHNAGRGERLRAAMEAAVQAALAEGLHPEHDADAIKARMMAARAGVQ